MQFKQATFITALLATIAAASPLQKRVTCYDGPYVIYARGTDPNAVGTDPNPNPTDGALENIAKAGVPNPTITALSYPASGIKNGGDYRPSWGIGIDNLQAQITAYVDSCPGKQIVLLGYSQGASVITGAMMGGQGRTKLAKKYRAAVVGGVAIADPSYVAGLAPLDKLSTNKDKNGAIPDGTVQTDLNSAMGGRFRSLCSTGDQYCANAGPNGGDIHRSAQSTWATTAENFLKNRNYS